MYTKNLSTTKVLLKCVFVCNLCELCYLLGFALSKKCPSLPFAQSATTATAAARHSQLKQPADKNSGFLDTQQYFDLPVLATVD